MIKIARKKKEKGKHKKNKNIIKRKIHNLFSHPSKLDDDLMASNHPQPFKEKFTSTIIS